METLSLFGPKSLEGLNRKKVCELYVIVIICNTFYKNVQKVQLKQIIPLKSMVEIKFTSCKQIR